MPCAQIGSDDGTTNLLITLKRTIGADSIQASSVRRCSTGGMVLLTELLLLLLSNRFAHFSISSSIVIQTMPFVRLSLVSCSFGAITIYYVTPYLRLHVCTVPTIGSSVPLNLQSDYQLVPIAAATLSRFHLLVIGLSRVASSALISVFD